MIIYPSAGVTTMQFYEWEKKIENQWNRALFLISYFLDQSAGDDFDLSSQLGLQPRLCPTDLRRSLNYTRSNRFMVWDCSLSSKRSGIAISMVYVFCGLCSNRILFYFTQFACVRTGVTAHISHIYKGINAMLIIRGPIKPNTFWIKIILAIFLAKTRPDQTIFSALTNLTIDFDFELSKI